MKLIFTFLFFTSFLQAQEFKGIAVYKTSKKQTNFLKDTLHLKNDHELNKQIEDRLKKMNQKTYTLNFDQKRSLYKEEVALKLPETNGFKIKIYGNKSLGKYYKDLTNKRFVNQKEIYGKTFLIKDNLRNFNWVLTSETKKIGNYNCFKAFYTRKVKKKRGVFKNGTTKKIEQEEIQKVVAWYTTSIPINNGPSVYQGLPGLILEINDGDTVILCTEIVLNTAKNIDFNMPKKGKEVSLKEFKDIYRKKTKEMMEFRKKAINTK